MTPADTLFYRILRTGGISKEVTEAILSRLTADAPVLDQVQTFPAAGAAITLGNPATTGSTKDVMLTAASCAITLPAPVALQSMLIRLNQDNIGGRGATWIGSIKWPGGAAPTLTPAAGAQDLITLVSITGASWNGLPAGYDLR